MVFDKTCVFRDKRSKLHKSISNDCTTRFDLLFNFLYSDLRKVKGVRSVFWKYRSVSVHADVISCSCRCDGGNVEAMRWRLVSVRMSLLWTDRRWLVRGFSDLYRVSFVLGHFGHLKTLAE